jgi:hypothetical protein
LAEVALYNSSGTQLWPSSTGTIARFTMKFDNAESWTGSTAPPSSTQMDSVSVAVHEFGHVASIGHTQWWRCWGDPYDWPSMCSGIGQGTVYFRYLETDDRNALNAKYP